MADHLPSPGPPGTCPCERCQPPQTLPQHPYRRLVGGRCLEVRGVEACLAALKPPATPKNVIRVGKRGRTV